MQPIKKISGFAKSFDGTPIFYESRGEGKPLILCYGIGCLMNHWHHQVSWFSNRYQVIMLDYRGHHQSPIPMEYEHLTIDACAADIKAVADHLGIKKASFWGHSWGTQLLLRLFDTNPELFDNFISVNGFASNPISGMYGSNVPEVMFEWIKKTYNQLPETSSYLWRKLVYNPVTVKLAQLGGGFNPQLTAVKDVEVYLKGVSTININVFISLFEAMMNFDGRSITEKVTCPTLIISGEQDTITPPKYQEFLHKRIKTSEYTPVPYGSHCTMLDMPEFVSLRIDKFLKDHGY